ncbi:MAG: NADH-quinone oxidoreductase subunit NuoH [Alphaproteobacteria bacterium]|nr:NADH-quinone oxidoreductase subunit NuoH [Alphaproteobacteria bacterium]MDP6238651.1 NADH-quinone oxidoreductase subunit NuoH [Alphaproteobacteria bacterium]MDP7173177.1 NADH-quinone oxidoreductase subunit NuoH [Alphaproteobacteria bacterium]MDP7233568.1 NADH-quinone oxidoreductase subunit NuoH [Alphaproteobacteria bacterium]MDP7487490.1 NADH-quinone oxidoreductase subunit NuoH [Alphaproteobacteria bacterium]
MSALWGGYFWPGIIIVAQILVVVVPLLLAVAYLTYVERKVIGAIQLRKGPNVVGPLGLFQPLADGLKLFLKETVFPVRADTYVFILAPMITFTLSFVAWAVIPFDEGWVIADINVGILYLFAVSSLSVYGVLMAGWASNSRYAFLGALRSAAQMVSYEVSMGFVIVTVLICAGTLNLSEIVMAQKDLWFVVPLFPMFVIFFISALAETNRSPFDLPEDEATLVAGYFVEYSSMLFALFYLGEYAAMILMSGMTVILFLGGWLPPFDIVPFTWIPGIIWFGGKVALVLFGFLWVRATFPRYRYDQLMRLGWKVFLPFSLLWVALTAGAVVAFDWFPK